MECGPNELYIHVGGVKVICTVDGEKVLTSFVCLNKCQKIPLQKPVLLELNNVTFDGEITCPSHDQLCQVSSIVILFC